jgi:hypothetical protein
VQYSTKRKTNLRETLSELGLRDNLVEEAVNLYFKENLTDFDMAMMAHFDLLIDIRDQSLKHPEIEQRLIDLKRNFGALIRRHGFIPNTGQMPSPFTRAIQVLHYPTPEEKEIQDEFDEMIDNLTILNAACCRVYPKFFASHFCRKAGKDAPEMKSIFIIDMIFTAMPSYCKLSGNERKEKYKEHHNNVKKALKIESDAEYLLPFAANLAIAVQLYNNEHHKPMLIFGATSELHKAFVCKRDAVLINLKKRLAHLYAKFPHPELLLNGRFGKLFNSQRVKELDELITFIFRNNIPEVDVPSEVSSTLFWKIAYGDMNDEEIAELQETRRRLLLGGLISSTCTWRLQCTSKI